MPKSVSQSTPGQLTRGWDDALYKASRHSPHALPDPGRTVNNQEDVRYSSSKSLPNSSHLFLFEQAFSDTIWNTPTGWWHRRMVTCLLKEMGPHLLFWLGPWVGLKVSPVGGLQGLFEGKLGGSGGPIPPGAGQIPSECWPWTKSTTGGEERGGGTVATVVGVSGGGFLGGERLAAGLLLGAPVSGALKSLELRIRLKTRSPWVEKWVPSLYKRISFPKKVAHESIYRMLWVLPRDSRRRLTHRAQVLCCLSSSLVTSLAAHCRGPLLYPAFQGAHSLIYALQEVDNLLGRTTCSCPRVRSSLLQTTQNICQITHQKQWLIMLC